MIYGSSQEWETKEGWEQTVCEAVHKHAMAPRWAKEVLDTFGELCDLDVSVDDVVLVLLKMKIARIDQKLAKLEPKVKKDIEDGRKKHRKLWCY